ncbi:MAG TPA: protein translocase subunit SecD [Candidatus Omnitrophica bacterium]|nr:protein translocase subunit SecD [Candidatus Omnitrophota bacterium]
MIKPKDFRLRVIIILGIVILSFFYIWPLTTKINLGLDLKGGMYVVLKVDTSKVPKEKIAQATEVALEVIRNRIDEFGVKEPSIQIQGKDSILVQLPGVVDRERVLKIIGQTAFLEFKLVEDDEKKLKQALEGNIPEGYELKYLDDKPLLLKSEASIKGSDLATATSTFDSNMFPIVTLKFNNEGTKRFAKVTKENVGRRLAIVLDGVVKSAPVIREPILSGDAQITGDFTVQEAQDLALVLRAGALPAPLKIEEERTVGPLLGSDSIRRGLLSIVIGAILVFIFMGSYYFIGGLVAFICLILDLVFVLAGLSLLRATLTLPGIAGMILTLGMAVDANVLVFERIREELKANKPLSLAVKNGFDKAKRTIFDANITTLIAALFLFIYGTGPIRGFATTLSLGIIASIFTSLFVGRTIFYIFLNMGLKRLRMVELVKSPNINFVKFKNICLVISLVLIGMGFFSFKSKGERIWGIDFKGGQLLQYKLQPLSKIEKVRKVLEEEGINNIVLQEFKDIKGGILIKSKSDITQKVEDILKKNFDKVIQLKINTIGPTVGAILRKKAILAVSMSLLGILIYVAFRFKHLDFAIAGIIALFHDVLMSIGFVCLSGYEISLLVITAILTIAGYSINDTIVIYDRIRELTPRMHKVSLREMINSAINQTLSRTIITSFTTILVVVCIFALGGEALKSFSFTLLVGFIAGTYSSIYIASPLVLAFRKFSSLSAR